jgi:hypothetical protein
MTELNYNLIDNITYNDDTYQIVFLKVFNITSYDTVSIFKTINEIYNVIKNNDKLVSIITLLTIKNNHMINPTGQSNQSDPCFSMIFLFSYDCLELFHLLFKEYCEKQTINEESYNNLLKVIENM